MMFLGIPLAPISFILLKYALGILPIYCVIPVAVGSDLIGMAMKCLAEASTPTSLTLVYRVTSILSERKTSL
ncbi:MAG: hypothetical protein QW335_05455 [Candidatus Nezhaarchaeales archaeon]